MALITSGRKDIAKQLKELLEQPFDTEAQAAMLAEIRESVQRYEERYGMTSDCIHEAIEAGTLIEDQDVGHWIFQYELLQDVEGQ